MQSTPPASAIGRLLEEVSWEGNARKYRGGGVGRENVLVAEVFGALDFLPRTPFLGEIIRRSEDGLGSVRRAVADTVEEAAVSILPGDIQPRHLDGSDAAWRVQPDVLIETSTTCCLVEAKRIRRSQFQEHQLLRSISALITHAGDRVPLLLLVTAGTPPFPVHGVGIASILDSIEHSISCIHDQREGDLIRYMAVENTSWTSWDQVSAVAQRGAAALDLADPSVRSAIGRLANSITDAVGRHS